MKRRVHTIAATLSGMMAIAGCGPSVAVTSTPLKPGSFASSRPVAVFKKGEQGPSHYQILGVVSGFVTWGRGSYEKALAEKLQAQASTMGADAIVGFHLAEFPIWATALAVRKLPAGDHQSPRNGLPL